MKKSTTSKNFAESKARAAQFGKESGRLSHSEVDLSDMKGSCTDLREAFESGRAYHQREERRQSVEVEEGAQLDTANKRALWEEHFKGGGRTRTGSIGGENIEEAAKESVRDVKAMFEKGVLNQDSIREYFNQRSETTQDKDKLYRKVKDAFESGVPKVRREEENKEILTERERIQLELEELRESSKNSSRFRLERGAGGTGGGGGLRRANSCSGVSGERVLDELDTDTMAEVSVTQKMVKAMFEQQTAPKYKFGGSGSNLSLNNSKEEVNRPVMKKSAKPKEERKWVLDSINKYFDVIVEEEEEAEDDPMSDDDSDYEYSDDEDESEYEYSEEEEEVEEVTSAEPGFQSTSKMRGLLSSVVANISGSRGNLGRQEILSSLKQNLGSRNNLRASSSQINLTLN